MASTFFCPFCGCSGQQDEPVCTRCGRALAHWKEHPYEERLVLTLKHPLLEHRMMAIQTLGEKRYEWAVPAFADMIANGHDVYTLREIAIACVKIDTEESRKILARLRADPSPVIHSAFPDVKKHDGRRIRS